MCGVVGFLKSGLSQVERIEKLRRGIRAVAHRGPEEAGIYDDGDLTLGTTRLSVIDPELGHQPMITNDGRFVAGFNGEVFNYLELRAELEGHGIEFATKSDTEVLLKSLAYWGLEALDRLNGQFGFAFYDRVRKELLLGRDPLGERPLFYTEQAGTTFFASEIKALFAFPQVRRELSPSGLRQTSRYWTPIPGQTCFAGIRSVPPGHVLIVRPEGAQLRNYYRIPVDRGPDHQPEFGFEEAKERLRSTLDQAVRFRLRGDYPLGVFLSGGLDSSIIASIVRQHVPEELPSFSIRVPDKGVDETRHQEVMTARLGTRHSTVMVTGDDIRQRFPDLVYRCEVPLHRSSPVACRMVAELVGQSGVRIVLGGEGADEAFLGYDIIKESKVLEACLDEGFDREQERALDEALDDLLYTDPTAAAEILRFFAKNRTSESFDLGTHLRRFESELAGELISGNGDIVDDDRRLLAWMRPRVDGLATDNLVGKAQWLDFQTLLIGYGMTCQADRPGAGCGIESRFPFMDRDVIDFAATLPREWKLKGLTREKYVLREAYAALLPGQITRRPKFGMRIPGVESLLPRGTGDWVDEILSPTHLRSSSVLDELGVRRLVDRVRACDGGRIPFPLNHAYMRVLSILLLEQRYTVDFEVPHVDIDRILVKNIDGTRTPIVAGRGI
ncbi:asparagine synthase (glutamine-hydrolyzing) [Streptomyces sp. 8N616]|uniref:asparagine synthase (glutamine-hydrolyzing) n=1 Tax=Streptomyces sp. 8N616 TaxID=3457414 RepID=UPI003FD6A9FD